jgi:stearoyl-CoA desaturase (Delta-9 desaturase)
VIAFWGVHLACLLVLWTGVSWTAVGVCAGLYVVRMFGVTAGYHRYFAHRTFKTSRPMQFLLALLATASAQQGPLWWAGHHRHHHRYSDQLGDVHSVRRNGFWWAHVGWITSGQHLAIRTALVRDLARYPELRFLDRYDGLPPFALALAVLAAGWWLGQHAPELGTSGLQLLAWGFFVSTTLLYHGTFTINSLAHVFGRRRFATDDDSRNSLILALITLGEGWHNNHHRYPGSERQGFYWWEIDLTHYALALLSWLGLVWDLRAPPLAVYEEALDRR